MWCDIKTGVLFEQLYFDLKIKHEEHILYITLYLTFLLKNRWHTRRAQVWNAVRTQSKLSIELKSYIRKKNSLLLHSQSICFDYTMDYTFNCLTFFRYRWHFNYLVILDISKTWNKKYLRFLKITKGCSESLKKNITSSTSTFLFSLLNENCSTCCSRNH